MKKPERIYNVSHTQLSIARYYGGIRLNGAEYHYDAESDMLIRMDIWRSMRKKKRGTEKCLLPKDGFAGF